MKPHAWERTDRESPKDDLFWVRCPSCGLEVLTSWDEFKAGTVDPGLFSSRDCDLEPGFTAVSRVMES